MWRPQGGAHWNCSVFPFIALFLELMMIRWAPAVVRLIAYYANLILISSFLGLGVGAIVGKKRKSLFGWLPVLLLINVVWLLIAHFITLPATPSESRFYTPTPQLVRYVSLVGIFVSNAVVFVLLGQRIGSLFEALPPLRAYSWDLGELRQSVSAQADTDSFIRFAELQLVDIAGSWRMASPRQRTRVRRLLFSGGPDVLQEFWNVER